MSAGFRISLVLIGMLLLACLAGTVAATSLGTEWKERPYGDSPFSGVKFSDNGDYVWAGGEKMILRSWDGAEKWGGRAGFITGMSGDARFIVTAIGQSLFKVDKNMVDNWSRTMDGQVKAVAISKDGTYVISADDKGNYNSWAKNGVFLGRLTDAVAKQVAISPTDNIVVATTLDGLRFYSPVMEPIWSDNKSGSLDTYIIITTDGKTVVTAGGNRVSSHTSTGATNWVVNPTNEAIIDIACNADCSAIILGSQDGTVVALDRYGKTRWTYNAGQWVNAVAISDTATSIAAGGLDGTVYLLDRTGKLISHKKMESNIQQRSLAMSRDGTQIAVADQRYLYGLSVLGDENAGSMETFTPPPLDPVRAYRTQETATPAPTTSVPLPTATVVKTTALPTQTQKSPSGAVPLIGALCAAGIVVALRRR